MFRIPDQYHERVLHSFSDTLDALLNEIHGPPDSPWLASIKTEAKIVVDILKREELTQRK